MKKIALIAASIDANAQQIKIITSVESLVPNGLGRSRIIDSKEQKILVSLLQSRPLKTTPETNQNAVIFA